MNQYIFPLRIYYEDTDFYGIVYHANYLNFFERARSEWCEQIGIGTDWQQQLNVYFLIRYANLDYLKPARLHQEVEVVTQISELKKASLVYDQYLRSKASPDTIFCKAKIKVVCVDADLRPQPIPTLFIEKLMEKPA